MLTVVQIQNIWLNSTKRNYFIPSVSTHGSRAAADTGSLHLLHADSPGQPGQFESGGCHQFAALHSGRHLQQTLPGRTCRWWVGWEMDGQVYKAGNPNRDMTKQHVVFSLQRKSFCWRFISILRHGRMCWSSQTSTLSLTGFTGDTRQQRESLFIH